MGNYCTKAVMRDWLKGTSEVLEAAEVLARAIPNSEPVVKVLDIAEEVIDKLDDVVEPEPEPDKTTS